MNKFGCDLSGVVAWQRTGTDIKLYKQYKMLVIHLLQEPLRQNN